MDIDVKLVSAIDVLLSLHFIFSMISLIFSS